jgi:uncharacterized protein YcbK (DUF882 family)
LPKPRPSTDSKTRAPQRSLGFIANLSGSRVIHHFARLALSGPQWRWARNASLIATGSLFSFWLCVMLPASTETAVANGDTRTLHLYHSHTGESIDATYLVDGQYDPAVLEKLNWFLRDWRRNEETNMDPRLYDAVWETYRSAGTDDRIVVLCGYRSPQTNAMLRRRSRGVAQHSQHMLGKAMDTTMPGMSMEKIREYAMRLQMGGVGYYPSSNFVHIDVGGVRAWPRMSYDQLVRLFPDGKTVHIAADGRTLPGYDEARADIEADGGSASVPPPAQSGNFFAWLFGGMGGGGEDEHEDAAGAAAPAAQPAGETYVAAGETYSADAAGDKTGANDASAVAADQSDTPDATADAPDATADTPDAAADAPPVPSVPVPPRRPTDLASLNDVPASPVHPNQQMAMAVPATPETQQQDAFGNLNAAPAAPTPDLPGIITQGPNDGRTTQSFTRSGAPAQAQALAYAPIAQMEGLRSAAHEAQGSNATAEATPGMVPARLDQSNFRSLTGATETAEMQSQTIFGPTLAGLRRAARVETAALSNRLESGYLARFGADATELAADHFAGPSVASLDSDKTLIFGDSSALRDGE